MKMTILFKLNLGFWEVNFPGLCSPILLKATLATTSITQPNLQVNVSKKFCQGRFFFFKSLVLVHQFFNTVHNLFLITAEKKQNYFNMDFVHQSIPWLVCSTVAMVTCYVFIHSFWQRITTHILTSTRTHSDTTQRQTIWMSHLKKIFQVAFFHLPLFIFATLPVQRDFYLWCLKKLCMLGSPPAFCDPVWDKWF